MTIEIRPVGDWESGWPQLVRVDAQAFGGDADVDNDDRSVMELDRSVLAWDGGTPVGCAGLFTFELSVPGGSVPTAAVTWVGVVPTHRRRGVMSALLADRHQAALDAGEPVAALWASQSAIYQRFGYGPASYSYAALLPSRLDLSRAPATPDVDVALMDAADDVDATRPVYDRVRRSRPGIPALSDAWQARAHLDREKDRGGASPLRTFVASRGGQSVGYVRFRQKHDWSRSIGEGTTSIREMVAEDPGAAAALWRHVHGLELMASTDVWNLPVDDPLLSWVSEIRAVDLRLREALYVRVLDVPAALRARTYRCDVDVVLDVTDARLPDNAGRWRLSGGPDGATCEPTKDAADLSCDVRVLGAALLGGTTLTQLAGAGQVAEHRAGSLDRATIAFSHPLAAWCPWVF